MFTSLVLSLGCLSAELDYQLQLKLSTKCSPVTGDRRLITVLQHLKV